MKSLLAIPCAALSLLLTQGAAAQTPPSPETLAAQPTLSPAQKEEVQKYVEALEAKFASADSADMTAMRRELDRSMSNPNARPPYKRELGMTFVKVFAKHATDADGSGLRAANTFIMARSLATAETVDFLMDHADSVKESSTTLRISASSQLPKAVEGATLSAPQLDVLGKRLAQIVAREKDWVVAAHCCETIVTMLRRQGLSGPQAEPLATSLASAVNSLAERTLSGSDPAMVDALQRTLLMIRNQLANVPTQARTALFAKIAPSLASLSKAKAPAAVTAAGLGERFDATVKAAGLLQRVKSTEG